LFARTAILQTGLDAAQRFYQLRKKDPRASWALLRAKLSLLSSDCLIHENTRQKKAPKPRKKPRLDPFIDPVLLLDSLDTDESSEDEQAEVLDCIVVAN
jgi:hypothetical protein